MKNTELSICVRCGKRAVVEDYSFNSNEGIERSCLNCGWFSNSDYLDDEEIERLRENYEDEFNYLVKQKIIVEDD